MSTTTTTNYHSNPRWTSPADQWERRKANQKPVVKKDTPAKTLEWRRNSSPPPPSSSPPSPSRPNYSKVSEEQKANRHERQEKMWRTHGGQYPSQDHMKRIYKTLKCANNDFNTWLVEAVYPEGTELPTNICWPATETDKGWYNERPELPYY